MEMLISIIIPVYKVEPYLEKCILSVVDQTHQNLEIILVDDGSPDKCGEICDKWKEKDSRIIVIHKKNGGLSDARNVGLRNAHGEYIAFVDSDDFIAPTMIEELLAVIVNKNVEIVECDYSCFSDTVSKTEVKKESQIKTYTSEEALLRLLTENEFKYIVWNKLYNKNIFRSLEFAVGKLHEDVFFTYQAFGQSKKIAKLEKSLYFYRQRNDSIMGQRISIRNLDSIEARKRQFYYMKENYPRLSVKAQLQVLGNCIYLGQKAVFCLDHETKEKVLKNIQDIYDEIYNSQPINESTKQKFWYYLAKKNLLFCCKIRNCLRIGL